MTYLEDLAELRESIARDVERRIVRAGLSERTHPRAVFSNVPVQPRPNDMLGDMWYQNDQAGTSVIAAWTFVGDVWERTL